MEFVGAYLIEGGGRSLEALVDLLVKEKVIARGSPDLFAKAYRSFGVDDAAGIRERARTKPVAGLHRVFVIAAPALTTEAQNSLLKTLEEPSASALFFIITPAPETLLPTVRSRVQTLTLKGDTATASAVDIGDFLSAPAAVRLEMLKPLYEHGDEGRDIGAVIAFLQSLEMTLAKGAHSPEKEEGIHAIYRARKYATDKGSLLKALLEQVALLSPRI